MTIQTVDTLKTIRCVSDLEPHEERQIRFLRGLESSELKKVGYRSYTQAEKLNLGCICLKCERSLRYVR